MGVRRCKKAGIAVALDDGSKHEKERSGGGREPRAGAAHGRAFGGEDRVSLERFT